ncbi:hotdog domain-containing protein [uncultured Draconibacterium sp.]|uniref:acyl-CoA thioesterase n=1 Tax=uncultured Draconibacterium sp. TaxID=1573823 RepID=UPI0029C6F94F|nr:hotdog domain-containing protein [uncultured Draconibacterium sp.]
MRQLSLKGRTFPTDLNHAGTAFGGWVMSKMDKAASIQIEEVISSPAVTVSVSNLNFIKPIHNGDVFMVYTKVDRIGNASIDIGVELIVRSREDLSEYKVTQGVFTFVAVDDKGKPVQIRSVLRSYVAPYIMEMLGDK